MLDPQDVRKFMVLPPVFNETIIKDMEKALDEYFDCQAHITRQLESIGGVDAFKFSTYYDDVEADILWLNLPKSFEEKFLAVLKEMRKAYCGG